MFACDAQRLTMSSPTSPLLNSILVPSLFQRRPHSTSFTLPERVGVVELARHDSDVYALEELIAGITAAFLCARSGIAPATNQSTNAYFKTWATVLEANSRSVVEASRHAGQAADLILGKYG